MVAEKRPGADRLGFKTDHGDSGPSESVLFSTFHTPHRDAVSLLNLVSPIFFIDTGYCYSPSEHASQTRHEKSTDHCTVRRWAPNRAFPDRVTHPRTSELMSARTFC